MKMIISGALILVTAFLSFRHGWAGLTMNMKPEQAGMMKDLGMTRPLLYVFSVLTLLGGIMVLFPQTFFAGSLLNALLILLIMALSLKAGNLRTALIEIPFLAMPLVMIWLGHPFGGQGK